MVCRFMTHPLRLCDYLYGVLASELTIALTGVGLDAGLGIFHTDAARRASLTFDAMEAVRPRVDSWLAALLADASFSKRDFYEEFDGTIPITRPLTSHLSMTAPIWRLAGLQGRSSKVCLRSAGLTPPCRCCPPPGEHGKGCDLPYQKPASSAGER